MFLEEVEMDVHTSCIGKPMIIRFVGSIEVAA